MLLPALLFAASATTADDCGAIEQAFAIGHEHRRGSTAESYVALRELDRCEVYWYEYHYGGETTLEAANLDSKNAGIWPIQIVGDPGVEVLVETTRHRFIYEELTAEGMLAGRDAWVVTRHVGRRSDYRRLCIAPCSVVLTSGLHHLAVSREGQVLAEIDAPLDLQGPVALSAAFDGYRTVRSIAALGMITGILGSLVTAIGSVATASDESSEGLRTTFRVGLVSSLVLGLAGGVTLWLFFEDVATLSVQDLAKGAAL